MEGIWERLLIRVDGVEPILASWRQDDIIRFHDRDHPGSWSNEWAYGMLISANAHMRNFFNSKLTETYRWEVVFLNDNGHKVNALFQSITAENHCLEILRDMP